MRRIYGLRIRLIYICIMILFISVIIIMNYVFRRSRNLLIRQEAGIISQYMDRNQLAMFEVTNSIRKLSAAASTNREVASYLNQSYDGNVYAAENLERVRAVEKTLTFYRNIFFDYRLHYIIQGTDGTVYSVADGIDNSAYFGSNFAAQVKEQDWYRQFGETEEISRWVTPCAYDGKGRFQPAADENGGEAFILFMRRIRDYNTQRFLGMSFVSFPADNLSQILIPYEGASLVLLSEQDQVIYQHAEAGFFTAPLVQQLGGRMPDTKGYFHECWGGQEYLVNYVTIDGTGWKLVNMVSLAQTTRMVDKLYDTVSILMLLIVLGAGVVCLVMYVYIHAPLYRLLRKVGQVNIGGTRVADFEPVRRQAFGIMEAEQEIGGMVDYIEHLSAQAIKQTEIEQNLRYEMLRAQLTPHFLFNTLNVIKWSAVISGAGNIADMIASLGILLENSMNRKAEEVSLRDELKMVEAWVEIKNWALKNRIQIHLQVPDELQEVRVMKFCLQPLVENAVLHGMDHVADGHIWIDAREYEGQICITIRDNGIGMDDQMMEMVMQEMDSVSKIRHVTGIGIKSIHELMKIKYGPEYGIRIESKVGFGTKVCLVFPVLVQRGDRNAESDDC